MDKESKTGILLMNLGSPAAPSVKEVKRYLKEFLMDEKVIDYPWLPRALLVKGIIAPFRSPKSAAAYQSIWWKEGSPLIVLTERLQAALQSRWNGPVEIAMRYGDPHPSVALDRMLQRSPGLEEVILMPLYPHYAMSSYETAVEYAEKAFLKKKYPFRFSVIPPYYHDAGYIEALSESIRPYLEEGFDYLLFSYHGVPERHIRKGDITRSHCLFTESCCETDSPAHARCYRHQVLTTTRLVAERLGLKEEQYGWSFQSRLGRDEWLKPYTAARFTELASEGRKKLLVACPAFVSDCLETLEEIGEQGKHSFLASGGESFTMIPCLNVQAVWVEAIVGMVRNAEYRRQETEGRRQKTGNGK